jgi:hypothetical protein
VLGLPSPPAGEGVGRSPTDEGSPNGRHRPSPPPSRTARRNPSSVPHPRDTFSRKGRRTRTITAAPPADSAASPPHHPVKPGHDLPPRGLSPRRAFAPCARHNPLSGLSFSAALKG